MNRHGRDRSGAARRRNAAAAICAAFALTLGGCEPAPPDRSTYVTTWVAAIEDVVRREATTGEPGIDPLASPTAEHHAELAEALSSRRASAGISDRQWEAAVLAHEATARDEIRQRAAALVQGWASVATRPADTVAEVLLDGLRQAYQQGWSPQPALVQQFETAAFDLTGERGEGGRWLAFLELLTSSAPDTRAKLDAERAAFATTLQACVRDLTAALPAGAVTGAASNRRLSDGMWEYAVEQWNTLPPVPAQLDGISLALREALRDRVMRQLELQQHLSGWAFAGTDEGRANYAAHTRSTVRTVIVRELLPPEEDRPLRMLAPGEETVTQVLDAVQRSLATDAQGDDVRFRMLHLRHGDGAKAEITAFARSQIGAARAAVERSAADLVAIAEAAVAAVPADITKPFERRDWALQEGVAAAAKARAIPEVEHDYLRLRLQHDPSPRAAFDTALERR